MAYELHRFYIDNELVVLPVSPSEWSINYTANVTTANILGKGEMNTGSSPNLATSSISSFFPYDNLGFIEDSDFKDRWEYVKIFKDALKSGKRIEYEITDTDVYLPCIVTAFEYKEQDTTGDVFYQLDIKEDIDSDLVKYDGTSNSSKGWINTVTTPTAYATVKENDSIQKLALRVYGDSDKASTIMKLNGWKNRSQIKDYVGKEVRVK